MDVLKQLLPYLVLAEALLIGGGTLWLVACAPKEWRE
jgi:hypothetical protein